MRSELSAACAARALQKNVIHSSPFPGEADAFEQFEIAVAPHFEVRGKVDHRGVQDAGLDQLQNGEQPTNSPVAIRKGAPNAVLEFAATAIPRRPLIGYSQNH